MSKPGGFLWDLLGEGYAYYLEALFGQNTDQMPERSPRIHLLEDNLLHAGSSRQGPGIVEFLRPKIPDNVLREIAGIEQQSFPDSMRSDIREIEDLVSKGGINLLLRVSGGKAVGSVISMPFDTVFDTLGERDPSLKMPDCPALYVESFALIPEHRNAPAFLRLFRWLVLESRAAGYELLVMHARESNGVSRFIQSRGGENLRSVPDWHGFGERFDYVELKLNGNPLLR